MWMLLCTLYAASPVPFVANRFESHAACEQNRRQMEALFIHGPWQTAEISFRCEDAHADR